MASLEDQTTASNSPHRSRRRALRHLQRTSQLEEGRGIGSLVSCDLGEDVVVVDDEVTIGLLRHSHYEDYFDDGDGCSSYEEDKPER